MARIDSRAATFAKHSFMASADGELAYFENGREAIEWVKAQGGTGQVIERDKRPGKPGQWTVYVQVSK